MTIAPRIAGWLWGSTGGVGKESDCCKAGVWGRETVPSLIPTLGKDQEAHFLGEARDLHVGMTLRGRLATGGEGRGEPRQRGSRRQGQGVRDCAPGALAVGVRVWCC